MSQSPDEALASEEAQSNDDRLTPEARREKYAPAFNAFEELSKLQFASPQQLSDLQASGTAALVAHAMKTVPFYESRLDMLRGKDGSVDLARWLDVPVLTRAQLVSEAPSLKTAELPSEHGRTRVARSSGTSGGQVEVLKTDLQDTIGACAQFRFWHDCKLDYHNNLGMVRALDPNAITGRDPNPEAVRWGPTWLPFAERGVRRIISVHTPLDRQLEWLNGLAPVYFHTMPSNLLALAHYVRDQGGDVSGLKGAITGGEVLSEDIRTEARRWLGIEAFDSLASAECGLMATQCPDGGEGYHIQSEIATVEVLKPNGSPCRPGETGFLTVTPLYGYAMPLVRYQSDDWVRVGEMCRCGRNLPVIAEILGRDRALLRFADSTRAKLEPDSDEIFRHLGPRRWQIAQTAADRIEVRVADIRCDQPADFDAMAAYVRRLIGRDMQIECEFVPVLGAASGGKFDRVICECL